MKANPPVWRTILNEVSRPSYRVQPRPAPIPLKEDTYSTTERQGPGRAFWFEKAEDAQAFAIAKAEIGHKVIYDNYSPDYVWVSHTKKYTTEKARHVLALIDPVTPIEDEGEKDVEKPTPAPKDVAKKKPIKPVEEWSGDHLSERMWSTGDINQRDAKIRNLRSKRPEYVQKFGSEADNVMQADATRMVADPVANTVSPAAASAKKATQPSPIAQPGQSGKPGLMGVISASRDLLRRIGGRINEANESGIEPPEVSAATGPLRMQAARIVAKVLGSSRAGGRMQKYVPRGNTPEEMIDNAVPVFLQNKHDREAWMDGGEHLRLIRGMNIRWNTKLIEPKYRAIMGFIPQNSQN